MVHSGSTAAPNLLHKYFYYHSLFRVILDQRDNRDHRFVSFASVCSTSQSKVIYMYISLFCKNVLVLVLFRFWNLATCKACITWSAENSLHNIFIILLFLFYCLPSFSQLSSSWWFQLSHERDRLTCAVGLSNAFFGQLV